VVSVNLNSRSWKHIFWVLGACALVFAIPYTSLFLLKINNDLFYLLFLISGILFFWFYKKRSNLKISPALKSGWALGVILALFIGLSFISINMTDYSDLTLILGNGGLFTIFWRGIVYGLISGLLISAFPFIAVWRAIAGSNPGNLRKIGVIAVAMVSILLASISFSAGISGFDRDRISYNTKMNIIAGLPTLLSGNPLASPIAGAFLRVSENINKTNDSFENKTATEIAVTEQNTGGTN